MKVLIFFTVLLCCFDSGFAQQRQDTVYIYFDKLSEDKYESDAVSKGSKIINKYRRREDDGHIYFYISDELFIFNKNNKADTLDITFSDNISFRDMDYLNTIREKLKSKYFFKKDVFEKVYLLEIKRNNIIKYDVTWATDIIVE